MERTERYCDGRLVKVVSLVSVPQDLHEHLVDGRHIWQLDGHELVTAAELEQGLSLLAQWTARKLGGFGGTNGETRRDVSRDHND